MPQYLERGNVTISSIRSGAAIVAQPSLNKLQIDKLHKLAEHDSKYRLKAIVRTSSGSETTFLTSALAVISIHFLYILFYIFKFVHTKLI